MSSNTEDLFISFLPKFETSFFNLKWKKKESKCMYNLFKQTVKNIFSNELSLCVSNCEILLDFTWEKLNTGHWSQVDMIWRRFYSLTSTLKALALYGLNVKNKENNEGFCGDFELIENVKEIIKVCDMGLLMGCPLNPNLASKMASYLHLKYLTPTFSSITIPEPFEKKFEQKKKKFKTSCQINIVICPSILHFQLNYYEPKKPVIMKGCLKGWPALDNWSPSYLLRKGGGRLVPVELGSRYTDDDWSQKLMTIEQFIKNYIVSNENGKGYLAQHQLFDQVEDLKKDILIPDYCLPSFQERDEVDVNAWFGPEGTVSPLHQDDKENIFCQIFGKKYFKLYHPNFTNKLIRHDNHLLTTTSQIDLEDPDLDSKYPEFHTIPFLEFELEPGDCLYLPAKHWHFIKSLSTSFSISYWWSR